MQKYFIHVNDQEGPYTYDELKEKQLKRDTPVWFDGLPDWQRAADVEELRSLFGAAPPPFAPKERKPEEAILKPSNRHAESTGTFAERLENYHPKWEKKRSYWKWLVGIVLVVAVAGILLMPKIKELNEKDSFRRYPSTYITPTVSGFMYNKLLGGISDLKISVSNSSQFAVDNVRCIVTYIRKSGETYKEEIIDSGPIPAFGNVLVDAPNSAAGMDVNVRVYKVNSSEAGVY